MMRITREEILDAMREVIDPELGINVVDLGLVYSTESDQNGVRVVMTMTAPSCPLHSLIQQEAQFALRECFPDVPSVKVEIVWEPRWTPAMMSDSARRQLGWV